MATSKWTCGRSAGALLWALALSGAAGSVQAKSAATVQSGASKRPAPKPKKRSGPDDAKLRKAWSFLLPAEQEDLAARFEGEVDGLDTLQGQLVRFVVAHLEVDPGYFPADAAAPFFEPREHAPADPIARRRMEWDDPRAVKARAQILESQPTPDWKSVWRYDWSARTVVRCGDPGAPERIFDNALAGLDPRADLVIACVEAGLDGGAEQTVLTAFAHAYTDREGWVYPGITLYDAWGSGREIEMPDIDNLGIVHSVTGERGRWVAPVPDSRHDELYDFVGSLYQRAVHYRGLRRALALSYLLGTAPLGEGYPGHALRLHGLWEATGSDPAALAPTLPDSAAWSTFLVDWSKRFDKDKQRVPAAQARLARLDADREAVRALLVSILEDVGALKRTALPKPPAPAKDAPSKGTSGAGPRDKGAGGGRAP